MRDIEEYHHNDNSSSLVKEKENVLSNHMIEQYGIEIKGCIQKLGKKF